jgi:8-oxo-dGTP diphosphatase
VIHVVAAALIDAAGRVLIAQRPEGKHLAGGWEFPGGKLEAGEGRRSGLARELREELGIDIGLPRPLMRLRHSYPLGEVLLDIFVVRDYRGEPLGLEGQSLRWCTRPELKAASLLSADAPIVARLSLPEHLIEIATADYLIGEASDPVATRRLKGMLCLNLTEVESAIAAHADFYVLGASFGSSEIAALCENIPDPVYCQGVGLEEAWALGASGTHAIS